jgi:ABC-type polysaccharide/polyol phosphate export permease
LLSGRWPGLDELGIMAAFALATFLAGGLFFRHMKRGFADVL